MDFLDRIFGAGDGDGNGNGNGGSHGQRGEFVQRHWGIWCVLV